MILRKSVRNLSEKELGDLRDAYTRMMEIKDNRGYNYLAGFHGLPNWYCWHHQRNTRTVLSARLFLPWHRAYLYRFEQAAQDQVSGVSIPWWDWRSDVSRAEGIPKAFLDKAINGKKNPLYMAHIYVPTSNPPLDTDTVRSTGDPSELPTSQDVDRVMQLSDFGDFNDELENIHDQIHVWTGGSMQQVAIAAFDPIFYSHHCMIDRIWWLWQLENGNSGMPPEMLSMVLEPFNLTVKDILNIYDLGYDYASTQVSVSTGG
ncbi:MAG: tyrosinase family protein [Thermoproteota archaeon]|nr:tyrosinase family protein [Thermoproteota archaeon]